MQNPFTYNVEWHIKLLTYTKLDVKNLCYFKENIHDSCKIPSTKFNTTENECLHRMI